MNNIKQIREQFDLITEKEEKEDRKLSALVRAGLYDAKKLPALKRALDKSADKITAQEKRMLINLLDSLIAQVISDDQVYRKVRQNVHNVAEAAKMDTYSKFDPRYKAGYPTDKEMPSVLILKRKAIRVYPDNQKVALYYSQALDKYVTIPYNDIQTSLNEAKKDDDEKKKKRGYVKPIKPKKDKSVPKAGSVSDTKNLLKGQGEYKSKLSRIAGLRSRGLNIGGIIGTMIHDSKRKERVKSSLAKVKARMDKTRSSTSSNNTAPAAPVVAPKVKDTKPKAQQTTGTIPMLSKKSPSATKAAMNKTLKTNPNATFSKAATQHANIKEDFRSNLQMIRGTRQEQIDEGVKDFALGDVDDFSVSSFAKDMTPGLGTARAAVRTKRDWQKGNYGSAALNAVDTAISGASDAAIATGIGAPVGAAIKGGRALIKGGIGLGRKLLSKYLSKGATKGTGKAVAKASKKTAGKATGKGLGKGKWLRRAGGLGALAGALGAGGSGSGSSASDSSALPTYNFSAKPTTSSSFANRAASDAATHQRDVQLNRQSQKAMMRESNVLETIKSIVENDIPEQEIQFNENKITINNTVAKKLLNVYESINKTNKRKMEQMLNESATSFNKVLTFAVRQ